MNNRSATQMGRDVLNERCISRANPYFHAFQPLFQKLLSTARRALP
jgi:hypothetical protein